MTKKLEIFPEEIFAPGEINIPAIPVCQYNKTIKDEKKLFSKEDFTKAQVVDAIREFIPNFEHEEKGKNLDQKM